METLIKKSVSAYILHHGRVLLVQEEKTNSPSMRHMAADQPVVFTNPPGGKQEHYTVEQALNMEVDQEAGVPLKKVGDLLCRITKNDPSKNVIIEKDIFECEIEQDEKVFIPHDPDKAVTRAFLASKKEALKCARTHPDKAVGFALECLLKGKTGLHHIYDIDAEGKSRLVSVNPL